MKDIKLFTNFSFDDLSPDAMVLLADDWPSFYIIKKHVKY